jgi:arylsulfatase A-like enzyme
MTSAELPNVLLLVVDCLRADRVFGPNRTCRTPNIDRLAARGVGLPNVFVENSITSISFAALLSGCYSRANGVTSQLGTRLRPEMVTLPDVLRANGYHTYAEVTGPLLPILGVDQGFDEYRFREQQKYYFTDWGDDLITRLRGGRLQGPWFLLVHFWELHEPRQAPPEVDLPEFGATHYDRALSGLDRYLGRLLETVDDRTLVVFTSDHGERVGDPIAPGTLLPFFQRRLKIYIPPREEDTRVAEDIQILETRTKEVHDLSTSLARFSAENKGRIDWLGRLRLLKDLIVIGLTRLRVSKPRGGFAGFVEWVKLKLDDLRLVWAILRGHSRDAQMHLLRTTLSQVQLQHGYHIYDYLQKVPAIFASPRLFPEPRELASEVRHVDLAPTLAELLGLSLPDVPWHGKSYAGILRDGAVEHRPTYLESTGGAQAEHAFYLRGVRSGGHKLAYAPNVPEAPVELYDLTADPAETVNLATAQPAPVARLRQEAEALFAGFQAFHSGTEISAAEQAQMIEKLKSLGYM